jgi:hypothetical protein
MPNIVADFPAHSPPPPADGKLKLHNTFARNVTIISLLFFLISKSHCSIKDKKPLRTLDPERRDQVGHQTKSPLFRVYKF